ncbi:MAG: CapA family protein [Agathobacter sp.]|nr:CapA family protein [Agathobacter sp.]
MKCGNRGKFTRRRNRVILCLTFFILTACGSKNQTAIDPREPECGAGTEIFGEAGIGFGKMSGTGETPPQITLVMVGDMLLHTRVMDAAKQSDGTYDFDAVFAHVAESVKTADVALVNQEVIIGGEELGITGYPCFNAPYVFGDALMKIGFDVICHGTNHALDRRKDGIVNCLNYWTQNHPEAAVLGIHNSQESQNSMYIYEKDGIRVAFLNYTYGTNGIPLPKDMPYAVDLLEEEKVIADIEKAEQLADFTVVCPHWGSEYWLKPDESQKKWTQIFLEHGVDLVLGTHPHVIEPIEWVEDEETGRRMLVYYSIGNFVSWTNLTGDGVANRSVGGLAEVTLTKDESGAAVVSDYGVRALVTHVESATNGVTVYYLSDYTEELAEKNEIRLQDGNFSAEYCKNLCDKVWGADKYH